MKDDYKPDSDRDPEDENPPLPALPCALAYKDVCRFIDEEQDIAQIKVGFKLVLRGSLWQMLRDRRLSGKCRPRDRGK